MLSASAYPFHTVSDTDVPINSLHLSYVQPPPRALNGGLYTGEPFAKGAPWANVPVIPDVDYMTNVNLKSANPPQQALYQYPGNTRPGNNFQANTGLQPFVFGDQPYNFSCVPCEKIAPKKKECRCKYASFVSGNNAVCDCDNVVYVEV